MIAKHSWQKANKYWNIDILVHYTLGKYYGNVPILIFNTNNSRSKEILVVLSQLEINRFSIVIYYLVTTNNTVHFFFKNRMMMSYLVWEFLKRMVSRAKRSGLCSWTLVQLFRDFERYLGVVKWPLKLMERHYFSTFFQENFESGKN